jgi:GntR family transcriptional regulator
MIVRSFSSARSELSSDLQREVLDAVQRIVEEGRIGYGEKMPAERDIAEQLGVNRLTLRRVLDSLAANGALTRNGRDGTRLAFPVVFRPLDRDRADSLTETLMADGLAAGGRLLQFSVEPPNTAVAAALALGAGSLVLRIKRVRTVDGLPFCVETSFFDHALTGGLSDEMVTSSPSLYALLETRLGIFPARVDSTLELVQADAETARHLALDAGAPLLLETAIVRDGTERPLELLQSANDPRIVKYRT